MYMQAEPRPARALLGATPVVQDGIDQWRAAMKAQGLVVTRMPNGPNAGKLAARYQDQAGTWRYQLAPDNVLRLDGTAAAVLDSQIAAGRRVEAAEKVVAFAKEGAAAVLDAPRQAVAGILGIPPWAITGLVLALVVFLVKTLAPALPGIATARLARSNPPRLPAARRGRHRRGD